MTLSKSAKLKRFCGEKVIVDVVGDTSYLPYHYIGAITLQKYFKFSNNFLLSC